MNLIDSPATSALLTEAKLRALLGISETTMWRIREDIRNGGDPEQLPPAIKIRNRRYYRLLDVDAWLQRRSGC